MLHQFISLTIIQTYLWKLDSLWQLSILKFPFIRSVLVFSFPYWLKIDHDHCDINWSRTKRPLQDISMASYDSWYNNDNFNLTGTTCSEWDMRCRGTSSYSPLLIQYFSVLRLTVLLWSELKCLHSKSMTVNHICICCCLTLPHSASPQQTNHTACQSGQGNSSWETGPGFY